MSRFFCTRSLWLFSLLILVAGCARNGVIPVRGIVKLDGRPLSGASVLFIAQDPGGRDARGSSDAEGVFHLSTFETNDGALAGHYKVVVQLAAPANLGAPASSPLAAQEAAPFPDRPAGVPPRFSLPDQTVLTQIIPADGDVVFDLSSK